MLQKFDYIIIRQSFTIYSKSRILYNTQGYGSFNFIICPKDYLIKNSKPFIKHIENNTPYHFLELKKDGTRVETFNKN